VEYVLIGFGIFVEAGGFIGFVKSKSKASLIAGGISGALLLLSGGLVLIGVAAGGYIGFVVTLVLVVMFGMRLAKTKKFMPSGMMLAVSIVVAGVLASMLLA
jgi:uncharacterized membrane protein (UPF0136 family)